MERPSRRELEAAAVICEPYAANMGLVPPAAGFLEFLREYADRTGALLIFDEVISGFRVGRGGAQAREGVTPDLTVLGKVIGGGLPAAAYAGRRDLMERIAPAGDVYQAGTLSGNPLATAAGLATLRLLDDGAYAQLERTTATLAAGLEEAVGGGRRPASVASATGLVTLVLRAPAHRGTTTRRRAATSRPTPRSAAACSTAASTCPPSQFEAWFPSLAHTDAHVERTLERRARGAGGAVSALAEVVAAADPALAPHAVAIPGRAASTAWTACAASCSRPSTRATSCTTASRAPSPAWTRTCACWQATRSTRSGLARLAETGDLEAVAELADLISASAQAHAEGRAADAEALWEASAGSLAR